MTENNKYTILKDSPDGHIRAFKNAPDHGFLGGRYLVTEGEASEEEIAKMKEAVVEQLCEDIRNLAREREDFFIIKKGERFPGVDNTVLTSVAVKYILPTVKND